MPSWEDFLSGEFADYESPIDGHRVETCLYMNSEADYFIDHGMGRAITAEQAIEHLKRSCEDGFIIQSAFNKDTDVICSCDGDCCGMIARWKALGGAADIANSRAFGQVSHYRLDVDFDSCIQCGACADRCPLQAITMGEDGYPVVNEMCFRCGQCAYICPQGARKLYARPDEENRELPQNTREDANIKAAFRFEHNMIR